MSDSLHGWTPELIQTYQDLPLPTLYEFALSGEKVSVELRKQQQEIQKTQQALISLTTKICEVQGLSEEEISKQKKAFQHIVMEVYDMILLLKEQADKSLIMQDTPYKKGRIHKKQLDRLDKQMLILHSFSEGVHLIEEKFLSLLQDIDLEPLAPEPGSLFSPKEHRAVARKKGNPPGTIQKVIRVGYKNRSEIIRYTDVIVNY
ncbi:MAG: nucleotide exchange factor GrpE [Chlamydiae bacterium]|nr:nucleotide exchange factor GrpE [Chlamydiota bacterium]